MSDVAATEETLTDRVREKALSLGFESVGFAPLRPSDHGTLYTAWIERGHHGTMDYLSREDAVEARLDPRSRWPELRSAVVVSHHYSGPEPAGDSGSAQERPDPADPSRGIVARYARGRDYHKVLKKKLLALLRWIEEETGEAQPIARAYVDTGPILERELAHRAGIGWQGRNTMLIDPRRGSYFFIGSLLLPLELEYDDPFTADRCGSCHACLDACPTGALLGRDENGAPVMDATRCISYLTIENQGPIPEELRPAIGNRIYGCDICQEVCPFNVRFAREASEPGYAARGPGELPTGVEELPGEDVPDGTRGVGKPLHPGTKAPSLIELMRMTRGEWDAFSRGSAIRRAGYAGFKRNVAVAMGNWLASVDEPPEAAVAALREGLEDQDPLVREHAAWGLEQARQ